MLNLVIALALLAQVPHAQSQSVLPQWRVTPQLRVDGNKADLSRPTFMLVDKSGTMFVGESSDNNIAMFDIGGKRVGTIGRAGSAIRKL